MDAIFISGERVSPPENANFCNFRNKFLTKRIYPNTNNNKLTSHNTKLKEYYVFHD